MSSIMPNHRANLLRLAFWLAALFAFTMAVLPHPPALPGAPSDKVQHIAAFLVLGSLGSLAYAQSSPFRLGLGLSLFGAFIEVVQAIPSLHRDSDPLDWLADTAAVVLVLLIVRRFRARRKGRIAGKH